LEAIKEELSEVIGVKRSHRSDKPRQSKLSHMPKGKCNQKNKEEHYVGGVDLSEEKP